MLLSYRDEGRMNQIQEHFPVGTLKSQEEESGMDGARSVLRDVPF
jgi:hypothetical protein